MNRKPCCIGADGVTGLSQVWFDATHKEATGGTRLNRYDAQGRLSHQRAIKADGSDDYDIEYDHYDAVGNLAGYTLTQHGEGGYTNHYQYEQTRFEGYKEALLRASSLSGAFEPGSTIDHYDVNGHLVGLSDTTKPENNRSFANDLGGRVLQTLQGGHAQRELLVNGEVMGRWGVAVNAQQPQDGSGNVQYQAVADFSNGFKAIDANYPSPAIGSYTVGSGDTLQSIAQAAYGDSRLWWKIAQANGINNASELRIGQTLSIPSAVAGSHNANVDYRVYDPGKVIGDTSPHMAPAPVDRGGCCPPGQMGRRRCRALGCL